MQFIEWQSKEVIKWYRHYTVQVEELNNSSNIKRGVNNTISSVWFRRET